MRRSGGFFITINIFSWLLWLLMFWTEPMSTSLSSTSPLPTPSSASSPCLWKLFGDTSMRWRQEKRWYFDTFDMGEESVNCIDVLLPSLAHKKDSTANQHFQDMFLNFSIFGYWKCQILTILNISIFDDIFNLRSRGNHSRSRFQKKATFHSHSN